MRRCKAYVAVAVVVAAAVVGVQPVSPAAAAAPVTASASTSRAEAVGPGPATTAAPSVAPPTTAQLIRAAECNPVCSMVLTSGAVFNRSQLGDPGYVDVRAVGAAGGAAGDGTAGGKGGEVNGRIAAASFRVDIGGRGGDGQYGEFGGVASGGAGGSNGGGAGDRGYNGPSGGGGGGGMTTVTGYPSLVTGTGYNTSTLYAPGGGGASPGYRGGDAGQPGRGPAGDPDPQCGGRAGTGSAGGVGGCAADPYQGWVGSGGAAGTGGAGTPANPGTSGSCSGYGCTTDTATWFGPGGGGAGQFGGGGGGTLKNVSLILCQVQTCRAGSGGGGGSSLPVTPSTESAQVKVSWKPVTLDTTTTLTLGSNDLPSGGTTTATAKVRMVSGSTRPAGTVRFSVDGDEVATVPLSESGDTDAVTIPAQVGGLHRVVASYTPASPFGLFRASTSSDAPLTVAAQPSSVSITPAYAYTRYGEVPPLSATVSPATASGTVTFLDDSDNVLGNAAISDGRATLTTLSTPPEPGTRLIRARYNGSTTYATSVSATSRVYVDKAIPTASLSLSSTAVTYGAPPTFTATLPAGSTGSVVFYFGSAGDPLSLVAGSAPVLGGVATFTPPATLMGGGRSYDFRASYGGDARYEGAASPIKTVTVARAPVTVTLSGSHEYGSAPRVTAVASDPRLSPTSAACSQVKTEAGSSVALTNATPAGSYRIVPNQGCSVSTGPMSSNYDITTVGGSYEVGKAMLTAVAPSVTSAYGGPAPDFTPSYTGFVRGETDPSVTVAPTCTSSGRTSVRGTSTITCAGGQAPNYRFTHLPGSWTVTRAPLTVVASSWQVQIGDPVPPITPTFSGLANGDTPAVVSGVTCSTTATAASPIGDYDSTCRGGSASNYDLTYLDGQVHVGPPAVVVTVQDTRAYGAPASWLGTTSDGYWVTNASCDKVLVNGVPTSAGPGLPVGSYPVVGSSCTYTPNGGRVGPNAAVRGVLTVIKRRARVRAPSVAATYAGDPVTDFDPTVDGLAPGDSLADLGGGLQCASPGASRTAHVGRYPLTCSGLSSPNYELLYSAGDYSVTPALVVVRPSNDFMTFGHQAPPVDLDMTGFQNGDDRSVLSEPVYCTRGADETSQVGLYTTYCSGAEAGDYVFHYERGSITVTRATAPVTVQGSRTYGDDETTFVGSTAAPGVPVTSVSCDQVYVDDTPTTVTAALPAGTYSVVGSTCEVSPGSDANVDVSDVTGEIVVARAPLQVSAADSGHVYGDDPTEVPATYSGLRNGDTVSDLQSAATCVSDGQDATAGVGSYALQCSGAGASNYTITYADATYQVTRAPLTVTASKAVMRYAGPVPTVHAVLTGLKNGDSAQSAFSVEPTCGTSAGSTPTVGRYPTTCQGAEAANYAITYRRGALRVLPAPVLVRIVGQQAYGRTAGFRVHVLGATDASAVSSASCNSVLVDGIHQPLSPYLSPGTYQLSSCTVVLSDATNTEAVVLATSKLVVRRARQVVHLTAPRRLVTGQSSAALSPTSSSGLPVQLAVSGPCTLDGNVVVATGVGECIVDAEQQGDANFSPASARRTVLVTPR